MIAGRAVRKFALTAHIIASVGWIGAIIVSLALGIAAVTTTDAQTMRSAYIALDITGRFALVPFALAALAGGLAQSLITKWGLIRHYWVVVKLIITVFATGVLLMYTQTLGFFAGIAANPAATAAELDALRSPSVVLHAGAALVLLVIATVLAVYKPGGMTAYGQRRARREAQE